MTITPPILSQFTQWFDAALAHPAIRDHHAMNLATCNAGGRLANRIVLLKEYDARGFVFYTNYEGRKSQDLDAHPQAALNLYWEPMMKQIRMEGIVEKVSAEQSDAYFASRPRQSQIGAWASAQSKAISSREELLAQLKHYEEKFAEGNVPRPPHWGGWRLIPDMIEFWQEGDFRLHQRDVYQLQDGQWQHALLNP